MIAVIAILSGILLPTAGAARIAILKAETRTRFAQWSAACGQFRQEYGYYPVLGTNGKLWTAADTLRFVRTLGGRNPDGTAVEAAADLNGNLKRLAFYTFSEADFKDPDRPDGGADFSGNELISDAFGNTEIGVLADRNGDEIVKEADDGAAVPVAGIRSGRSFAPSSADIPVAGVRAGALFYSAGRGESASDLILSWR